MSDPRRADNRQFCDVARGDFDQHRLVLLLTSAVHEDVASMGIEQLTGERQLDTGNLGAIASAMPTRNARCSSSPLGRTSM